MIAPPGYSACCLERHLQDVLAFRQRLDRIRTLVDEPSNLSVLQGLQLYALCLAFRPDLIIELGRGYGNSTCVFAAALQKLGAGRVVSFDLDTLWDERTLPKLMASELSKLTRSVEARIEDIKLADFGSLVGRAGQVLVFWDAHGWEAADGVLCRLLPTIASRPHIVACHDFSDARYVEIDRAYHGRFFWRDPKLKEISARYTIGWVNTQEPQFIPLLDFLWRNRCELRSADEDLAIWRRDHAAPQREVERAIGADVFAPGCHWGYFSLNDAQASELTFPAMMR